MRILGIDPGYAILGYGIIDVRGNRFTVVDYGAITTDASMSMPDKRYMTDLQSSFINTSLRRLL